MITDYKNSTFYVGGELPLASDSSTNVTFFMSFGFEDSSEVKIEAFVDQAHGEWLSLNYKADTDEEIYGMGLQPTVWNFKGKSVPLIVSEGGVGRGLQPLTRELDLG